MSGSGTLVLRLSAFEHAEQGSGDDTCASADTQHTAWELRATSQFVPLRPREPQRPGSAFHAPCSVRGDLTDAQWVRLEPLLPKGKKQGRPPIWTRRQLIDGIRWRTRAGAPWRDVPERYGPWDRAYDLFRR